MVYFRLKFFYSIISYSPLRKTFNLIKLGGPSLNTIFRGINAIQYLLSVICLKGKHVDFRM